MKKKPKERYLAVVDDDWKRDELEGVVKDSLPKLYEELKDFAEDPDYQLFPKGSEAVIYKLVPIARVTPAHTIAIQSIDL